MPDIGSNLTCIVARHELRIADKTSSENKKLLQALRHVLQPVCGEAECFEEFERITARLFEHRDEIGISEPRKQVSRPGTVGNGLSCSETERYLRIGDLEEFRTGVRHAVGCGCISILEWALSILRGQTANFLADTENPSHPDYRECLVT